LFLEPLGQKSVKIAMIYTHVLNTGLSAIMSPLDISMETQRFQLRIQIKPQKLALACIYIYFINKEMKWISCSIVLLQTEKEN